jgi:hypothetical protein
MLNAEHRRPLAAFLLLLAFASVVMANGLRDQVVRVFVDSGAPRPLISAVVPDIVLGHALRHTPAKAPASAAAEVPASTESQPIQSRPVTPVAAHVAATTPTQAQPHRTGHVKHHAASAQPVHLSTPKAPVHVASPTPLPKPATPAPAAPSSGPALGHGHTGGTSGLTSGSTTPHQSWGPGHAPWHPSSHPSWHPSSHPSWHPSSHHGDRGSGYGEVRGVPSPGGNHYTEQGHHGSWGHHGDRGTPRDHGNRGDHGMWAGPGGHGDRGHGGYGHHRH